MDYRHVDAPDNGCPSCIAWYAEYQRASLLLERLAEDFFADQAAFDRWMTAQMRQVFKSPTPQESDEG